MKPKPRGDGRGLLLAELAAFVRLRWLAGAAVLVAALLTSRRWSWFSWFDHSTAVAALGGIILLYNAALWLAVRRAFRRDPGKSALLILAWAQIFLDLTCLTVLTLLTGGVASPLRPLFFFHMIFASLLLPRLMAYGVAGLAMLLMALGLWVTGEWPQTARDDAAMLVWVLMLPVTVWLANGITRRLRRQRRRLARQNRHIRRITATLKRQQQALIQHEKMAAAGRMAAGVAHEVANPVASMDGLLQLMERRPEKSRPDAIATLREQLSRINQIVRRMTAFAHPGEGQWQNGDLSEVVGRAMDVVRFDPRLKRVQIDPQLATDLPPVRMQPDAIQQVVINLVINAVDAMEQVAEPRLLIRTSRAAESCLLEVSDNGHGIRREDMAHIFEPFFTTKPVGKGTGLGLSITYSHVENHGGKIDVESTAGQGTRFKVRLPVAPASVAPESQPQAARSAP